MLDNLRVLNSTVGRFTPDEVIRLTPNEFTNIVAGGLQKSLNDSFNALTVHQASIPAVMVENNNSDDKIIDRLRARQKQIDDILNPQQAQITAKQQETFANMFIFKKGGRK